MGMLTMMLSLLLLASCEPWEDSRIPRLIFQGRTVRRLTGESLPGLTAPLVRGRTHSGTGTNARG